MPDSVETINLENCAREPIHIPGAIQPYGLLFVLREPDLTVLQVSENVTAFLGKPLEEILDHKLSSFLNQEQIVRVQFALDSVDPRDNNPVDLRLPTHNDAGPLDGFVHRHAGFSFLELEPASHAYNARFLDFYKAISKLTSRLHTTTSVSELLSASAPGIREITGFDRVMIYRFSENFEVRWLPRRAPRGSILCLGFGSRPAIFRSRRAVFISPIRSAPLPMHAMCRRRSFPP